MHGQELDELDKQKDLYQFLSKLIVNSEFGLEVSRKVLKQITDIARGLADFEEKGISVSSMYGIDCDYRYLYIGRNYLFYRIEKNKIIIIEMLDEKEDFMHKLFGITTTSQDSFEYWDE